MGKFTFYVCIVSGRCQQRDREANLAMLTSCLRGTFLFLVLILVTAIIMSRGFVLIE